MSSLALTELLGLPVFDPAGGQCGRVREVAVAPQEDRARIAVLIVRTKSGDRVMPFSAVNSMNGGLRIDSAASTWPIADGAEGLFLLERDLLDQQIIDVHGRKVVRVNDVDISTTRARPTVHICPEGGCGRRGRARSDPSPAQGRRFRPLRCMLFYRRFRRA